LGNVWSTTRLQAKSLLREYGLRQCIRPVVEAFASGHDVFRALLFLISMSASSALPNARLRAGRFDLFSHQFSLRAIPVGTSIDDVVVVWCGMCESRSDLHHFHHSRCQPGIPVPWSVQPKRYAPSCSLMRQRPHSSACRSGGYPSRARIDVELDSAAQTPREHPPP
jgi:hypothetical protein